MTPIGLRLQLQLDNEAVRMTNEWFFKWHRIGKDGPVEIDSFQGRLMTFGGTRFDGQPSQIYWNTIQHYLRQKISSTCEELEQALKDYPVETRKEAIKEAKFLLMAFAGGIRQKAIEKDRILRGDGMRFPEAHDRGHWQGGMSKDIEEQASALLEIYATPESRPSWFARCKAGYEKHQWWLNFLLGVIATLAALTPLLV